MDCDTGVVPIPSTLFDVWNHDGWLKRHAVEVLVDSGWLGLFRKISHVVRKAEKMFLIGILPSLTGDF